MPTGAMPSVSASQDEHDPEPVVTTVPRRPSIRRAILFIAAVCILIIGGTAFWYVLPPSRPARPGTQSSSSNKSTNINATATPGGPARTGTLGLTDSTLIPGTGQSAPTGQPTASSSPSSTPAPQPTPTQGSSDCLSGSTGSLTITQLLGASASLPGPAVTLTNCSPVAGNWTAKVQIDSGSGWTSCSPESGNIPAHGTQTVHIVAGSSNVLIGTYTARWIFTMGSASWTVHVTLIVVA